MLGLERTFVPKRIISKTKDLTFFLNRTKNKSHTWMVILRRLCVFISNESVIQVPDSTPSGFSSRYVITGATDFMASDPETTQPTPPLFLCGSSEALVILRVARRDRWLVRGWAFAAIIATVCAVINLVAASAQYVPLLTGSIGLLSGALALPAIRFAKTNAEDADVFEFLALRLKDPNATDHEREADCKRAWDYIDGRLRQIRG
jgi:hypothetical protein